MSSLSIDAGHDDVLRAASLLADRLSDPLRPLAAVAYNYWWTWQTDGPAMFAAIDSVRWQRRGHNPVRLLRVAPVATLQTAAADPNLVAAVERLARSRARRHSGHLRPRRARRAPPVGGDGEPVSADPRTQVAAVACCAPASSASMPCEPSTAGFSGSRCDRRHRPPILETLGPRLGAGTHECRYDPKHRDVAADECNDHRRDRHLGGDIAREIRRQRDSFDTLGHHPHAADGLLNGPSLARSPTPLQAAQPEQKSSRNAAFFQYFPPATTRSCCRRRSGADSLSAAHESLYSFSGAGDAP